MEYPRGKSDKASGRGGSMQTPLSGQEQISKISSGTGEGPIQTPLDKGHADTQRGGSSRQKD